MPLAVLIACLAALTVGVATAALVALVRTALLRRGILDRPNERSSHTVPVPRGGGIGLVPPLLAGWVALDVLLPGLPGAHPASAWIVPLSALGLAAVSWIDDLRTIGPLPRLAAQFAAVFAAVFLLPGPVFQGLLPQPLDAIVAAIGWIWFVNLFNFMDGIDGISGVEAAAIGGGLFAIGLLAAPAFAAPHAQGLAVAAAAIGFLVWNWHPARIFLGDIGSVPLGYLAGWLLLALAATGQWQAALILPLYYLTDATVTLLRRLAARERVWEAHRSHFYQQAVQTGRSHATVSRAVALANAALAALALGATLSGQASWQAWAAVPAAGAVVAMLTGWMSGWRYRPAS